MRYKLVDSASVNTGSTAKRGDSSEASKRGICLHKQQRVSFEKGIGIKAALIGLVAKKHDQAEGLYRIFLAR